MAESEIHGPALFRGLLLAQGITTVVVAALAAGIGSRDAALSVLAGGGIAIIAAAWAGFQLWLHPGNRNPERMATAATRAEMGRVAIVLVLLWLTLSRWPEVRQGAPAMMLFAGFFLVQLAGWIWLAKATGSTQTNTKQNG